METLTEKYVLLDSLLFKLITTPEKERALFGIPEIYADKIIILYHSSLFAGHQALCSPSARLWNFLVPCLFICLVLQCLGVWLHVFGPVSTELTQFFTHSLGSL